MLLFLLESSIILWTIWTSAEPSGICCHSAHHCMAWVPLCLLLSWAHFATSSDRTRASTLFQSPSETRRNSLVSKSSTLICTQDCHSDFWRMVYMGKEKPGGHPVRGTFYNPGEQLSPETNLAGTLVLGFQALELWEIHFLLFEALSIWSFAPAARAD